MFMFALTTFWCYFSFQLSNNMVSLELFYRAINQIKMALPPCGCMPPGTSGIAVYI